ncbi:hypothetical protein GCM10027404_00980 [Arthrobacter tumbae]|uniref:hypothetical protein n=1 Tax=Arthrobacter tumbae TaxID=163874 RepID=UPI00195D3221|nr:hypothetical protein [Arthrobacter tumbae]MBM7780458.1 hypothetical protein [Arthrobacter tumbae]
MSSTVERQCDEILTDMLHAVARLDDPRRDRAAWIRVELNGTPAQKQRLRRIEEVAERQVEVNRLEALGGKRVQEERESTRDSAADRKLERQRFLDGER